jgi:phosphatidate cytidylyltransferase
LIAAVLIPFLIWAILFAPPIVFFFVVSTAGLVAWREFSLAAFTEKFLGPALAGAVGMVLIMWGAGLGKAAHPLGLALAVILGGFYYLLNFKRIPSIIDHVGRYLLGQVHIGFLLSFLLPLYALDHGPAWVLFVLTVTFLGDTAAFYTGRTVGRRPLYAEVSPNKTMEGLWGGVAGGGITAIVVALIFLPVPWYEAGLVGLVLGLWGSCGDLFESMLKRSIGIKDSGGILLGHGGLLDRIDSLLFNVPAVYLYASVISPTGG